MDRARQENGRSRGCCADGVRPDRSSGVAGVSRPLQTAMPTAQPHRGTGPGRPRTVPEVSESRSKRCESASSELLRCQNSVGSGRPSKRRHQAQQRAGPPASSRTRLSSKRRTAYTGLGQNQGAVRAQALKTLESAGLSQADIHHLWTGDHSIDAHSSVLQTVLAKAAAYDLAQAKASQIRQSGLPQVIRPWHGNAYRGNGGRVACG